jgi:hypothetical protein
MTKKTKYEQLVLYLGLVLLDNTNDDRLINWWEIELILQNLNSIEMKIWKTSHATWIELKLN